MHEKVPKTTEATLPITFAQRLIQMRDMKDKNDGRSIFQFIQPQGLISQILRICQRIVDGIRWKQTTIVDKGDGSADISSIVKSLMISIIECRRKVPSFDESNNDLLQSIYF